MNNGKLRGWLGLVIIVSMLLVLTTPVRADIGTLRLRIANSSVENGDSFRVVIEVTVDEGNISSFGPLVLQYDPSLFTYTSATMLTSYTKGLSVSVDGDKIRMNWNHEEGGNLSITKPTYLVGVYFKALKTGTGNFSLTTFDTFYYDDQNNTPQSMTMSVANSLDVTVTAPVIKSDNNNLKSLEVSPGTLTPEFAAGTTSYSMAVGMDVNKVTVSAAPADSKASVAVSGNEGLIYGENAVKVVVTAENGSKKTYTITVTREAPAPSPSPSPTPAVTINQPDGKYTIIDPPEGTPIPGGFYSTLDSVGGQSVTAFRAIKGDLTLYYLQTDSGSSNFYYLDYESGEYKPFLALSLPAIAFPVLSPDSSVTIPDGFTETTLDMNGSPASAWQSDSLPAGQLLVYLMNNDGEKDFYVYDTANRLLSLYAGSATPVETTEPAVTETTVPTPSETDETPVPAGFDGWPLIAILLGALCLILIGVIIYLVIRGKNDGEEPPARPKTPSIRRVE